MSWFARRSVASRFGTARRSGFPAAWTTRVRLESPTYIGVPKFRKVIWLGRLVLVMCLVAEPARAGDEAPDPDAGRRVPWRGSKMKGSPDPPAPYTAELAFPHLKFEFPVVLDRPRGPTGSFSANSRGGSTRFPTIPAARRPTSRSICQGLSRLYSASTASPFIQSSTKIATFTSAMSARTTCADGSVVSRFTVEPDRPAGDRSQERTVLLKFYSGGHNGGCLDFGNDGYLYISTGDAAVPSPPDVMMTGQDCSDLLSSVLRIDVDHSDPGKPYRIPADNPFVNVPGVRPEIWAFGFRNPWKMSIDQATGELWVGDVGWELWEMVFKVKRGGNYGWSVMEGPQPVNVEAPARAGADLCRRSRPIPTPRPPRSPAATFIAATRLPELAGAYIYGDYQSGIIWGLRSQGDTITWQRELARTPAPSRGVRRDT